MKYTLITIVLCLILRQVTSVWVVHVPRVGQVCLKASRTQNVYTPDNGYFDLELNKFHYYHDCFMQKMGFTNADGQLRDSIKRIEGPMLDKCREEALEFTKLDDMVMKFQSCIK